MKGTYKDLVKYLGGAFEAKIGSGAGIRAENSVTERSFSVVLADHSTSKWCGLGSDRSLKVEAGEGADFGMWVPYQPKQAIYGFAGAGQTWAVSGPFSGCNVEIGTRGGRVYFAHLSVESGSTATAAWDDASTGAGSAVWLRQKVPLASDKFYASSYVFASWADGAAGPTAVQITQVDVKTTAMGGESGKVFKVTKLVG